MLSTFDLLEEAFKKLQKNATVLDAMATFKNVESMLSSRPEEDLCHNNIVNDPRFLSGIFKVMKYEEGELTTYLSSRTSHDQQSRLRLTPHSEEEEDEDDSEVVPDSEDTKMMKFQKQQHILQP